MLVAAMMNSRLAEFMPDTGSSGQHQQQEQPDDQRGAALVANDAHTALGWRRSFQVPSAFRT